MGYMKGRQEMPPGRRVRDVDPNATAFSGGQRWKRLCTWVLSQSDVCGYCGHPGSSDVDHIIPKSIRPDLAMEPTNLQPIHGASKRCYTCDPESGRNCNREKGTSLQEDTLVTTEDWFG